MSAAVLCGWLVTVAIAAALAVPVVARYRGGKRASPLSTPIRIHVVLGVTTSALAFGHALTVLPALGSPAATAGGAAALLPGVGAFFVLLAHSGIGLSLRDPKLRDRARKRRLHGITAATIVVFVVLHVLALNVGPAR